MLNEPDDENGKEELKKKEREAFINCDKNSIYVKAWNLMNENNEFDRLLNRRILKKVPFDVVNKSTWKLFCVFLGLTNRVITRL